MEFVDVWVENALFLENRAHDNDMLASHLQLCFALKYLQHIYLYSVLLLTALILGTTQTRRLPYRIHQARHFRTRNGPVIETGPRSAQKSRTDPTWNRQSSLAPEGNRRVERND